MAYVYLAQLYLKMKMYDRAIDNLDYVQSKGYRPAYYLLGELYWRGIGVETNLEKAKENFGKAAALGNPYAKRHLGNILLKEHGLLSKLRGLGAIFTANAQIVFLFLWQGPTHSRL